MHTMTVMMWAAAVASATATWIWLAPAPFRHPNPAKETPGAGAALIVELLRVAIGQGSSLPYALIAVGETLDGQEGQQMAEVGHSLNRGVRWHTAWRRAVNHSSREPTRRQRCPPRTLETRNRGFAAISARAPFRSCEAEQPQSANLFALLEDALESSWTHGVAPAERLRLMAEQIDRDALSAIEREASRLSVRLLMPTGLCFLPAFVAIGVVPAVASFAW